LALLSFFDCFFSASNRCCFKFFHLASRTGFFTICSLDKHSLADCVRFHPSGRYSDVTPPPPPPCFARSFLTYPVVHSFPPPFKSVGSMSSCTCDFLPFSNPSEASCHHFGSPAASTSLDLLFHQYLLFLEPAFFYSPIEKQNSPVPCAPFFLLLPPVPRETHPSSLPAIMTVSPPVWLVLLFKASSRISP